MIFIFDFVFQMMEKYPSFKGGKNYYLCDIRIFVQDIKMMTIDITHRTKFVSNQSRDIFLIIMTYNPAILYQEVVTQIRLKIRRDNIWQIK